MSQIFLTGGNDGHCRHMQGHTGARRQVQCAILYCKTSPTHTVHVRYTMPVSPVMRTCSLFQVEVVGINILYDADKRSPFGSPQVSMYTTRRYMPSPCLLWTWFISSKWVCGGRLAGELKDGCLQV